MVLIIHGPKKYITLRIPKFCTSIKFVKINNHTTYNQVKLKREKSYAFNDHFISIEYQKLEKKKLTSFLERWGKGYTHSLMK